MDETQPRGEGRTTQQLKADIDAGRTGSKVRAPDPGLSPLGTDDEAAGTPNSPDTVAEAQARERRIGAAATANDHPKSFAPAGFMLAVIVVLAIVIVLAFMHFRG